MSKFFLTVALVCFVVASGVSPLTVLAIGGGVAGVILGAAFLSIKPPVK